MRYLKDISVQDNTNFQRRASDLTAAGTTPTIIDVWKILVEVREDVAEVKRQHKDVLSAFIKDDLGEPGFGDHRKAHIKLKKSEEIVQEYKTDATKKVIGIIIVFVIGLITSGMLSKIGEHLK